MLARIVLAASIAIAATGVTARSATTSTIIGNYPQLNDNVQFPQVNPLRHKVKTFAMPSDHDYYLTSVTLRLGLFTPDQIVHLQLRDHTGSDDAPGSNVLLTFTAPPGGGTANADYTFTPNDQFTLQAGAHYWLYLAGGTASGFDWKASIPAVAPTGIATFGVSLITTDAGATWAITNIISTFSIEGKVVPNPSALAPLVVGVFMSSIRRARK